MTGARLVEAEVKEFLKTNDAAIFDGIALALFQSVYKNEAFPLNLRLHAAGLAAPYESPRLLASASVVKHVDGNGGEDYASRILGELARIRAARAAEATEQSPQSPPTMPNVPQANGVVECVPELWKAVKIPAARVVLYTEAGSVFQVAGHRYAANAAGELDIEDPLDARDLIATGRVRATR